MDAIRASVVFGRVSRTSTPDIVSCLPHRPTLSPSSPTNFSLFLSPSPLSTTSTAFPPSPFHVHMGRQTPITDFVREKEDAEESNISLKDLSQKLKEFADARDWEKYHTPRNLLLAMVGEIGELSEIFQWKGEVKRGLENWEESEKEHLGEELSDVLLYLIRLADVCGIDLAQASLNKILKNAIKYPIHPTDHS